MESEEEDVSLNFGSITFFCGEFDHVEVCNFLILTSFKAAHESGKFEEINLSYYR